MNRGRFITLEGGEGVGKSTQARLLAEALEKRGISTVLTREPGGTVGAEAIRELLLHPPVEEWGARAEALLFAAARADHVETLIRPALEQGKWVICDRFVDSTRAYQGGGGGLSDEDILSLHAIAGEGMLPDLTILLEVSPQLAAERLAARDAGKADAIGGRDAAYHARVAEAFAHMADAAPDRFVRIDGGGSADYIHERIMHRLSPLLGSAP